MLMGYNNDVPYRGVVVHVQTEDHGLPAARITTQVFFSGAILDSRTISYENEIEGLSDEAERDQRIRRFMQALHKSFFRKIRTGAYDARLPIQEPDDPAASHAASSAQGTTVTSRPPSRSSFATAPPSISTVTARAASARHAASSELAYSRVPAWQGIEEPDFDQLAELLAP